MKLFNNDLVHHVFKKSIVIFLLFGKCVGVLFITLPSLNAGDGVSYGVDGGNKWKECGSNPLRDPKLSTEVTKNNAAVNASSSGKGNEGKKTVNSTHPLLQGRGGSRLQNTMKQQGYEIVISSSDANDNSINGTLVSPREFSKLVVILDADENSLQSERDSDIGSPTQTETTDDEMWDAYGGNPDDALLAPFMEEDKEGDKEKTLFGFVMQHIKRSEDFQEKESARIENESQQYMNSLVSEETTDATDNDTPRHCLYDDIYEYKKSSGFSDGDIFDANQKAHIPIPVQITPVSIVSINNPLILGAGLTTYDTLNWSSGNIQLTYSNGGFSQLFVRQLNVGIEPLSLVLNTDNIKLTQAHDIAGTFNLLTATTITGDVANISVQQLHPFAEIKGVVWSKGHDGHHLMVTFAPASTTTETDATTVSDAVFDQAKITQMSYSETIPAGFTQTTVYQRTEINRRIAKTMLTEMRQNRTDSFEALVMALAQEDTPHVIKFKGDYRVFATPYMSFLRNTVGGYVNGSNQKYYGMMVGGSRRIKSYDMDVTLLIGLGATKTQMNSDVASRTMGKSMLVGGIVRKTFFKALDMESNISTMVMKNNQERRGNPSPNQSYIARAAYNMYALSWRNEAGYVFRLSNGYSIRPDMGLQMNIAQRTKIQETNAGIYNQSYRTKITRNGEIYGGIGVRKKWTGEGYEAKLTVKYEVGQKSGNGKTTTTVYADGVPNGWTYSSVNPERLTQYLNIYGSFLGTENNWKIVPGITATFQRGQQSLSGVVKIEKRF